MHVINRVDRFLIGLYLALALTYSVVTPPWEAPDEVGHFAYVRHQRLTGTLPDLRTAPPGEMHQPPLYYAVTAVFTLPTDLASPVGIFRPNPDFMWNRTGGTDVNAGLRDDTQAFPYRGQVRALHMARLASVLMGAVTVWLVARLGRLVFPQRPFLGLCAGGLVAGTPQFLFLSGTVNNDNLLILVTTGALWQTLQVMRQPAEWSGWFFVGLWLAAAALTKLTGVAVGITAVLTLSFIAVKRRNWTLFWRGGLALGLPPLLLSGWWYGRNHLRYGDPLALGLTEQIFAVNVRQSPLRWVDLVEFARVQFRTFWGTFGWMNVPAPDWYFTAVTILLLAALVGLILFIRQRRTTFTNYQKQALGVLALAIVAQQSVILIMLTRCSFVCYQGRFLLPVVGPIMLFVSAGLWQLFPASWRKTAVGTAVVLWVGIALFMAFAVIRPA